MRSWGSLSVAVALVLVSCDGSDGADSTPVLLDTAAVSTTATPRSNTAPSDTNANEGSDGADDACMEFERLMVEGATESFYAYYERYPTDGEELVDQGYLPGISPAWDLGPDGTVVRVSDGPCTLLTQLVDSALSDWGEEMIAEMGGDECAGELASLLVATYVLSIVLSESATDPVTLTSFEQLEPYLDRPITLWTWDGQSDQPTALAGSGCNVEALEMDDSIDCVTEESLTLEMAVESFYVQFGRFPNDESELIGTFLPSDIPTWDLGPDGQLERVEGAACATP